MREEIVATPQPSDLALLFALFLRRAFQKDPGYEFAEGCHLGADSSSMQSICNVTSPIGQSSPKA